VIILSRDLTPKEAYYLEKELIAQGRTSILDMMENIMFVSDKGSTPLYSSETIEHCRQYPLLGSLLNNFDDIYLPLSRLDGGYELLSNTESTLKEYIETGKGDRTSPLIKWFEGELDTRFYYSEQNDKLFKAAIMDEAKGLSPAREGREDLHGAPTSDHHDLNLQIDKARSKSSHEDQNSIRPEPEITR